MEGTSVNLVFFSDNTRKPQEQTHTLGCGHSFDLKCINELFFKATEKKELPSCPECNNIILGLQPKTNLQGLVNQLLNCKISINYPLARSSFKSIGYVEDTTSFVLSLLNQNDQNSSIRRLMYLCNDNHFVITIYFYQYDTDSDLNLLDYFQKNNILSFQTNYKVLTMSTYDEKEFLSALSMLIDSNDYDQDSQVRLDKLIHHPIFIKPN
jgi:hypothetical protein